MKEIPVEFLKELNKYSSAMNDFWDLIGTGEVSPYFSLLKEFEDLTEDIHLDLNFQEFRCLLLILAFYSKMYDGSLFHSLQVEFPSKVADYQALKDLNVISHQLQDKLDKAQSQNSLFN